MGHLIVQTAARVHKIAFDVECIDLTINLPSPHRASPEG